jgi:hypothetical protein
MLLLLLLLPLLLLVLLLAEVAARWVEVMPGDPGLMLQPQG